jgi:hypothetical protein
VTHRFTPADSEAAPHARPASTHTARTPRPTAAYSPPVSVDSGGEPGSGDPLTCLDRARNYVIDARQARRLCRDAGSTAPVDCYSAAGNDSLLPARELVALCRCATSLEPADCYSELEQNTLLSSSQIVARCSPVMSGIVDRNCRPLYWYPRW